LHLAVLKGAAAQTTYTFCQRVVSIGRTAEATDRMGRTRQNDVAFDDAADGTTETVGRAHARVTFDASLNHYAIFDEGSSNGTSVVRKGATIPVPPRDPRGVRIESGDQIHFGRAVVGVSLASDEPG
jgi:pSer/pThr/pTyr-binding forkhead associated (FHA) protein